MKRAFTRVISEVKAASLQKIRLQHPDVSALQPEDRRSGKEPAAAHADAASPSERKAGF